MDAHREVKAPQIREKNYLLLVITASILLVFFYSVFLSLEWFSTPVIVSRNIISGLTSNCQIPVMDPFDESILRFIKTEQPIECNTLPPLTEVTEANDSQGGIVLRVREDVISSYKLPHEDLHCCYSSVTPFTLPMGAAFGLDAGDLFNVSKCFPLMKEVRLQPGDECLLVYCATTKRGKKTEPNIVYNNMHPIISSKAKVKKRIRKRILHDDEDRLNVLILGYDSMSHLNLVRTMPKTVQFLEDVGFVHFSGFTRVGENAFSNAIAMLTGLSVPQAWRECVNSSNTKDNNVYGYVDSCPFIWKYFQEQGYVTADFEDFSIVGSKRRKLSFVHHPTNYYIQPYITAAETYLTSTKMRNINVCLGSTSRTDHVLNYLIQFLNKFKNYLYFSYAWLGNFSQNDVNFPSSMEMRTLKFFQSLALNNVYNNTLVVFVSNYGIMHGEIRSTTQGWYEERMPFLYISVPPWFKKKYPEKYTNLVNNKGKLVSAYDLHFTLRDVLRLGRNTKLRNEAQSSQKQDPEACSKCRSLFREIRDSRTCTEVGVPEEYCICKTFQTVSVNNKIVLKGVAHSLRYITRKIFMKIKRRVCSAVTLRRVVEAKYIKIIGALYNYVIKFETNPGLGLYQAYLVRNEGTKTFALLGPIQRLNASEIKNDCVHSTELKKFCYCL